MLRGAPIGLVRRPSKPPISNSGAAHQLESPHMYIFGYICETGLEKFWGQSCFDAGVVLHCFSLTAHGLSSQRVWFEVAVWVSLMVREFSCSIGVVSAESLRVSCLGFEV